MIEIIYDSSEKQDGWWEQLQISGEHEGSKISSQMIADDFTHWNEHWVISFDNQNLVQVRQVMNQIEEKGFAYYIGSGNVTIFENPYQTELVESPLDAPRTTKTGLIYCRLSSVTDRSVVEKIEYEIR